LNVRLIGAPKRGRFGALGAIDLEAYELVGWRWRHDRSGAYTLKDWHNSINDPALADTILDRFVHSSVKLELKGESVRRVKSRGGQ